MTNADVLIQFYESYFPLGYILYRDKKENSIL